MEYIIKYNDATIVISKVSNNEDSICKGKSDDATIGTDPPSNLSLLCFNGQVGGSSQDMS